MKKPFAIAVVVSACILSAPAGAQTYNTWNNPDANTAATPEANNTQLQSLLERLRAIIDQAEKDRAADPVLLRDLRALTDQFDPAALTVSLNDTFEDGDFTGNPVWTVTNGRYFIEQGWGLRNVLEKARSTSGGDSGDVAQQIFGQILNQALGGSATSSRVQPTAISTEVAITNAFQAEIEVSSWVNDGRFIAGPYQGNERDAGYRIAYNVGGSIDLLAVSSRGVRMIQQAPGPFALEDKTPHTIQFSRDQDGRIQVSLDGETIIDVTDQSFRDAFQGWRFSTEGGDFIVKRITVRSRPQ